MQEKPIKECQEKMNKAVEAVEHNLGALRTGRASVRLVEGVVVPIYGSDNPLNQVATISTPDATTVAIQPWDPNTINPIEKAILQANIGLTPSNDGRIIRLHIPPLTEETRREMVKKTHTIAEEGRIAVRNLRRHSNDEIKKTEKTHELSEDESRRLQHKIQEQTDAAIKKIDAHLDAKEKEIMTV